MLHFDAHSELRVRQAWAALDARGVPSAAATYDPDYRPHVTLAIVDTPDPEALAARLDPHVPDVAGMPLTMTGLGFFLTGRAPAYLAVAPTRRLLELHEDLHHVVDRSLAQESGTAVSWPYYRPGSWMPHCTLAMDVACPSTVADALTGTALPITATVSSVDLVPLSPNAVGAAGQDSSVRV